MIYTKEILNKTVSIEFVTDIIKLIPKYHRKRSNFYRFFDIKGPEEYKINLE